MCALILFGAKYATTNTSMLYTAKGAAAFLVPLGAVAAKATGNWNDVLFLATGINVITVIHSARSAAAGGQSTSSRMTKAHNGTTPCYPATRR
jgi:hypothetical protein